MASANPIPDGRSLHERFVGFYGVVVLVLGLAVATPTSAQQATAPQDTEEDAASYATQVGVTIEEAVQRLNRQPLIGELGAALEQNERATFGGLYISHRPQYKIVAQFTRDGAETLGPHLEGSSLAPFVVVEKAEFTYEELLRDVADVHDRFDERDVSIDVDVPRNRVVIEVPFGVTLEGELPASVVTEPVPTIQKPVPATDIYGGLALTTCTAGFTVYWGPDPETTLRSVTTAGHCANSQSYAGYALTFDNNEQASGVNDEQSHRRAGFNFRNWIYDRFGTNPIRSITSTRSWSIQNIGDYVCKSGMTTGYTCGYITSKHGQECVSNPAFFAILVRTGGPQMANGGDSGGPFFGGNAALGTLSCVYPPDGASYIAINFVESGLGRHVLTSP